MVSCIFAYSPWLASGWRAVGAGIFPQREEILVGSALGRGRRRHLGICPLDLKKP